MDKRRVLVLHQSYGCESGCCGHIVEVDGREVGRLDFGHPRGRTPDAIREYVIRRVTEACGADHVADIDWDHCVVLDD
jgi:hypothetical protein